MIFNIAKSHGNMLWSRVLMLCFVCRVGFAKPADFNTVENTDDGVSKDLSKLSATSDRRLDADSSKPTDREHVIQLEKNADLTARRRPFDVDEYLEKYGYLPSHVDGRAHSEQTRRFAIQIFQKFAQLPQTGELDYDTVAKMRQPRCGYKDVLDGLGVDVNGEEIRSTSNRVKALKYMAVGKWPQEEVTWNVKSFTAKLPMEQQRIALENSIRHWNDASALRLTRTNESADIEISFESGEHGDGEPFSGKGGVLAHAFAPEDGRAHLDDDEEWVFHKSSGGSEIETVLTHELGHSLGLSHSTTRGSIMAPFYIPYWEGFSLHMDDIAGMQYLYGPPNIPTTPPAPPVITTQMPEPRMKIDKKLCNSRIKAATVDQNRNLVLFIGTRVYKLYDNCVGGIGACLLPEYPKSIRDEYKRGPKRVTAAIHVPDHRRLTYLFKGRKVWRYKGKKLERGFPKKMERQDAPYTYKPSAAYIFKNQFADFQWYMFGGRYFWEISLHTEKLVNSIYKTRTYWDGMPVKPDAMVQTHDGSIYVFKGKTYNKYDHLRVLLEKNKSIAIDFIGEECRDVLKMANKADDI